MQRDIRWTKWQDPYQPLVESWQPDEDEHDPDYHKSRQSFGVDTASERGHKPKAKRGSIGPAVLGPFGPIPLRENNLPCRLFNFWMGDSNFPITKGLKKVIAAVPGVEAIDFETSYRFRVAIGRAFDERAVKEAIVAAVQPPESASESEKSDPLDHIKQMLSNQFSYWVIYRLPEGKIEVVGGNTLEEVQEKSKQHTAKALSAIASWEQ